MARVWYTSQVCVFTSMMCAGLNSYLTLSHSLTHSLAPGPTFTFTCTVMYCLDLFTTRPGFSSPSWNRGWLVQLADEQVPQQQQQPAPEPEPVAGMANRSSAAGADGRCRKEARQACSKAAGAPTSLMTTTRRKKTHISTSDVAGTRSTCSARTRRRHRWAFTFDDSGRDAIIVSWLGAQDDSPFLQRAWLAKDLQ